MKKLFIILGLLFLTGCSVNYDLKIDEESIYENIYGNISKDEFDSEPGEYMDSTIYDYLYNNQSPFIDSDKLYNKSIKEEGNTVYFDASYSYNGDYAISRIINECYEKYLVEETDNVYFIDLSGDFYCQYAKSIDVNVTTDNYVISNNATKQEGNTYTWVLSKGLPTDINMTISKKIKNEDTMPNDSINYFRIIGLGVLLVLIIVLLLIYKKHKNSDK